MRVTRNSNGPMNTLRLDFVCTSSWDAYLRHDRYEIKSKLIGQIENPFGNNIELNFVASAINGHCS